jgi:DNA polymerase zeta
MFHSMSCNTVQLQNDVFMALVVALVLHPIYKLLQVLAGFSGRMPMAELADAIVATARATLEAAIHFVNSHPSWHAKVVYGDTDSLFVLLPGRTKATAFVIGAEIAEAITAMNPSPVKLKFDKVSIGQFGRHSAACGLEANVGHHCHHVWKCATD